MARLPDEMNQAKGAVYVLTHAREFDREQWTQATISCLDRRTRPGGPGIGAQDSAEARDHHRAGELKENQHTGKEDGADNREEEMAKAGQQRPAPETAFRVMEGDDGFILEVTVESRQRQW